ncbi:DUF2846 domain-containing protein [Flavivirga spongiicola]|uniref:DUF2846 domain-containing protein n=1 Tax=Flavivirga spongiicola TaxID=421621 RepID=A0ABU7XLS4_9FLAO|nr:DUF2846 domain-containing protein [Flavivirga sp. MEBiC05379]MDO5981371.1 DUF2846 domain-containing protein [Flavivirga sp. MEBiC05379]
MKNIILILSLTITNVMLSQDEIISIGEKPIVYLIRDTGLQGALRATHIFFNTEKVCKLNNKRFSMHSLEVGEYTIYAQSGGKKPRKKALNLNIKLEAGKTYYIYMTTESVDYGREFYELTLGLITEEFALDRLKTLKLDKKCY